MSEKIDILLVEDNPGDIRLTKEAFCECKTNCRIHVTRDGEEAMDFVYQRGTYADADRPDLILLDLNLPNMDGSKLLTEIAEDPDVRRIPVIHSHEFGQRRGHQQRLRPLYERVSH